jgi:exosome complex RNA-binding protein Rrp4
MSKSVSEEIYLPGQPIISVKPENIIPGEGTYLNHGLIRASLVGCVTRDDKVCLSRVCTLMQMYRYS